MRVWFVSAALALMCMAQNAAAGTILIVGDSISAGFGLDTRLGWVSLLEQRLEREGHDDRVVNASISGDTSAGGQARLPALLTEHKPDVVIVELGGNDGLRGQLRLCHILPCPHIQAQTILRGFTVQRPCHAFQTRWSLWRNDSDLRHQALLKIFIAQTMHLGRGKPSRAHRSLSIP